MKIKISLAGLLLFAALLYSVPCCANSLQCSDDAIKQAHKLLGFHFGADSRIEIDKKVKELPSIQNPAGKKQKFQVLEVWGYIYKGRYRMRFIYYQLEKECVLMGQEILEYARL
jgi:hypothetical protein